MSRSEASPRQAMGVSKAGAVTPCLGRARSFHRKEWAMGTCRFTVGRETTPAEVQTVRWDTWSWYSLPTVSIVRPTFGTVR